MAIEDTRYTEADIIAHKAAMKFAGMSVTGSDGKSVKYPALREMQAVLVRMEREVYGASRNRRRVQQIEITSEGS